MRKITRQSVRAFFNGQNFKSGNMQVQHNRETNTSFMYLHGNRIASKQGNQISLYDCGWQTVTTKERLNGILDALNQPRIYQTKGIWYQGESIWYSGTIFNQ